MNHEYIHMHPPALGDLDADLLDPPWTVRDLIACVVAAFILCAVLGPELYEQLPK